MIRKLRGHVSWRGSERVEVMTPAGVGYDVQVPESLLAELPAVGEEVELDCALVVREDALRLYGFGSRRDRELFLRLQDASGVGPQLALSLLGTLSAGRLIDAIRSKDYAALQMVSGVGRKTAERIAVDLTDKLDDLAAGEPEAVPAGAEEDSAVEALVALGYGRLDSEKAVARARQGADGDLEETEALIRAAMEHL